MVQGIVGTSETDSVSIGTGASDTDYRPADPSSLQLEISVDTSGLSGKADVVTGHPFISTAIAVVLICVALALVLGALALVFKPISAVLQARMRTKERIELRRMYYLHQRRMAMDAIKYERTRRR